MKNAGFYARANENWLGWKWLNYHIYRGEFLVSMSRDEEKLIQEVTEPAWILFKERRGQIQKIHDAIGAA